MLGLCLWLRWLCPEGPLECSPWLVSMELGEISERSALDSLLEWSVSPPRRKKRKENFTTEDTESTEESGVAKMPGPEGPGTALLLRGAEAPLFYPSSAFLPIPCPAVRAGGCYCGERGPLRRLTRSSTLKNTCMANPERVAGASIMGKDWRRRILPFRWWRPVSGSRFLR
jgi:hypothetical protein